MGEKIYIVFTARDAVPLYGIADACKLLIKEIKKEFNPRYDRLEVRFSGGGWVEASQAAGAIDAGSVEDNAEHFIVKHNLVSFRAVDNFDDRVKVTVSVKYTEIK